MIENIHLITACKHVYMYIDISLSTVQMFIEECIMTSKLDHPNVLSLIGISIDTDDARLLMIMPFMHHGDVKSFLKSKRGNKIEFDNYPKVPIAIYVCIFLKFMYCKNFSNVHNFYVCYLF